jgi:hypothetical protein
MNIRTPFQWSNANFAWETNPFPNQSKNPFTWDDCALITQIIEGITAGKAPEDIFKDKEKKKKFIKLICKVQGKEYTETKEMKEYKIRISDISLVAKEVLGIDLKINL